MSRIRRFILLIVFLNMYCLIYGQDIHHSQFYTSPLNLNPGLTGIFNGDQRLALNYRRQWFVEDIVRYMTLTGSYDIRIYPKKWKTKGRWNAGLLFNYDQAGDSKLGLANLGLSISYTYPITNNNLISLGILGGFSQRQFKTEELQWDAQWIDNFDPNRPTGENLSNTSNQYFDFGTGINYRWQKSSRTKVDLGAAAYHLTRPEQKFFDQSLSIKLPIRFNINMQPAIKLASSFDLLLHGQYQLQQAYRELVLGGYGKFYLNQKRGKELNLLVGLASRLDDAIVPKIAVEYKTWYAGFSYDITTSGFKNVVNNRGGPEFSLMYILVKAHPLTVLKSCPIF